MQIIDLKPNQKNVEIHLEVIDKEEPRPFNSRGRKGKVCKALCRDPTGYIILTLWNEQIDEVDDGDNIAISVGNVTSWKGQLQISVSKAGSIKKIMTDRVDIRCNSGIPDSMKDKISSCMLDIQLSIQEQRMKISKYCTKDELNASIENMTSSIARNLVEMDNMLLEHGLNFSVSGR